MRRLPVYLLLDTSGSMHGEPIESVRNGLQLLVSSLRQDPYALETAFLSVITFNSTAQQVIPLVELTQFQMPTIEANGVTQMGKALQVLADAIEKEVVKGNAEQKGDWKPVVFLLSDGAATDDLQPGIDAIKRVKIGTFVCCAAGTQSDTDELKRISENVVNLDIADSNSIKSFFKWVSSSISVSSQKLESGNKEMTGIGDLPPPPAEINVVL